MLISATRIHDGLGWMPRGTVLEVADDGSIAAIHDDVPEEEVTYYDGIICPGFVNVHCHLELSHMKGAVPEKTGLVPFLEQVNSTRNNYTEEQKITARHKAFKELQEKGIVAIGDITNTSDTQDLRVQNKMHFHSFVESIGFTDSPQRQFDYAMAVYHAFCAQKQEGKLLNQSIVPHAPYSVSEQLFALIDGFEKDSLLSIHNQECAAEDEYYKEKKGAFQSMLHGMGIDDNFFKPSNKSSLATYSGWLSNSHPVILVHNTYSTGEDIKQTEQKFNELYWCLCPNANMYIENRLPDISLLRDSTICIGTDSLASNHQLSILAELQTIKKNYLAADWDDLLKWATYNGAKALQMDNEIGSIEVSKKPGLLLIKDLSKDEVVVL
ncbi:MAG: amidohydrolase family protein [Flavipsychrobacter sp.]